jgi:RNA polymerase sigma factor (sigma-70 family)
MNRVWRDSRCKTWNIQRGGFWLIRKIGLMARSLDAPEQDELLRRAGKGDTASQELLVEAYMPTVVRMAAARGEKGIPLGDLVQEGALGLVEAIRSFDASGEADFARYAEIRIDAQLAAAIDEEAASVRDEQLLVTAAEDYFRVEILLRRELHREPTEAEVAGKLEWTVERTRYVAQVVADARKRHDEELLQFIDPEALDLDEGDGADRPAEIDPTLN